ncbi:uncharacterized protein LOC142625112 [Castanea sativa]|uniref:uncharacterized protein LOC142625112 n=1 Tax=Castanea sativa TaxID=21020 RepID=UPI003F650D74
MSVVCWNCQGLGNPCTVKALQKVVLEEDPILVFLIETKLIVSEMDGIKSKLDWQQGLVVPSVRRGGGLALLWRRSTKVDVQNFSPHHIDGIVTDEHGNKKWRFTSFYGHPETSKREESWQLLEELEKRYTLPWICMGDFNEIMHLGEKVGGSLGGREIHGHSTPVHTMLRGMQEVTLCLEQNYFWPCGQKIAALQKKLQGLEGRQDGIARMEEIHAIKMELNQLMVVEEDMWHQRSRNCWLRSGDRNTSFFHSKASNIHQRNTILRIRDAEETWQEDEEEIGRTFMEYFEQLFTSSQPNVSQN